MTWIGNSAPEVEFPMQQLVTRELTVRGAYGFVDEFELAADALAAGWIDARQLIECVAPLEEGEELFRQLAAGSAVGGQGRPRAERGSMRRRQAARRGRSGSRSSDRAWSARSTPRRSPGSRTSGSSPSPARGQAPRGPPGSPPRMAREPVDGLGDLLAGRAVDAVIDLHAASAPRRQAIAAAQAGLHVVVEKPMALTAAECSAMIDAAERGRRRPVGDQPAALVPGRSAG